MFKKRWIGNCALILLVSCVQPGAKSESPNNLPVKVAVIDTGLDLELSAGVSLCLTGHYDFTKHNAEIGKDTSYNKHGTNITKIIASTGGSCILVYKVVGDNNLSSSEDVALAIRKAVANKADIINISLSGKSTDSRAEFLAINYATQHKVKVVVAAGNDNMDLDVLCQIYPACYFPWSSKYFLIARGNFIVAGSKPNGSGNFAEWTRKESFCVGSFCGTSTAAAIATSKIVKELR